MCKNPDNIECVLFQNLTNLDRSERNAPRFFHLSILS